MAYSAGVKFGGMEEWQFAWDMYSSTKVPSEKSLWMRSLADSLQPSILQRYSIKLQYVESSVKKSNFSRYLDASLDREKIRPQDVPAVLAGVARNPSGSLLAWRHVQMHWDELAEDFGAGSFIMGSIIESTTSHFSTEFDYEQVKQN